MLFVDFPDAPAVDATADYGAGRPAAGQGDDPPTALDMAALRPGRSLRDGRVRVDVLAAGAGGDLVRITVS